MTKTEWGGDIKNRIKYSTAILIQEWPIKSIKTIESKNSDLLDKYKTPCHCGFPLANLQKEASVDCVPYVASVFNLLI